MRDYYEEALAGDDLADATFVISYEFTDPPAYFLDEGQNSIGDLNRIADGRVEVAGRALLQAACDVQIIGDCEPDTGCANMMRPISNLSESGPRSCPETVMPAVLNLPDVHNAINEFAI
ncbi:hypothetical protein [Sphingobium sp. CFD-2]|uniref:hypothetical protein n=1 Tax=Sphingobium sp. CFD-2 TaxID=2878542 RepID=UPI00214C701C|nr:hypothetical protein [Sphingobium sp. CFD-2]